MKHALDIQGLTFSYPLYAADPDTGSSSRQVFEESSLSVPWNTIQLIMGKPDSGKTTLARIIAGLVPRYTGGTLSGSISIGSERLDAMLPFELFQHVGLVFQDPDEQLLFTTVEDEIVFPLESMGLNRPRIHEILERELRRWDLTRYRATHPGSLSGGEKKRLLLAVLSAVNPAIWILDEVFEELDADWRIRLIDHLKKSRKTVIMLASRYIDLYPMVADSWAVIDGASIRQGTQQEVLTTFNDLPAAGLGSIRSMFAGSLGRITTGADELEDDTAPLLSCSDIRFSYGANRVRDDEETHFQLRIDDFHIAKGETVTLFGPNGSGKSTFGRVLCGLLPVRTGEITLAPRDRVQGDAPPRDLRGRIDTLRNLWRERGKDDLSRYHGPQSEELMGRIGYLPQNPDYQIFLPTVKEELLYGLLQTGMGMYEAETRMLSCADQFGIKDIEATPATMGYGARKVLQAAVYHLLDRECYIFDEADSGLSFEDLKRIIMMYRRKRSALILITHDARIAEAVSDRMIIMDGGTIKEVRT